MAINLAYLALGRSRYRDESQDAAASELSSDRYETDGVHTTTPFRRLVYLAGEKAPLACKKAVNGDSKRPEGIWSWVYAVFFRFGWDEKVAAFSALFALTVMLLGVAGQINAVNSITHFWFTWIPSGLSLVILMIGTIFPVLMVTLGRHCVEWAKLQAREMGKELDDTAAKMKIAAQRVQPPAAAGTNLP